MPLRRTTRVLLWLAIAFLLIVTAGFLALINVPAPVESWLQQRALLALREHYKADVRLENLEISLVPVFRATADNFLLPNRRGADLPPLITVKHLIVQANLLELLRTPVHLRWVKLDGLEIQVTPKPDRVPDKLPGVPPQLKRPMHLANFVIDRVDADQTELRILRKDPSKEPLVWKLRNLRLRSAGVGQPMKFRSELTNPTPPGVIQTSGSFGPWNFDEPSETPVSGHYDFRNADLDIFNGISGILSSVGDYDGTLHNIVVDGTTDTPDFKLDSGGQAVHLTTQFHAIVDGTNGNTYLEPVKAHFLNSDVTVVKGKVEGRPGQKGKVIALDIDMHNAHLQDVLALASKSQPPMLTGGLQMRAALLLPPGKEPVLRKMVLDGNFQVTGAAFTDPDVKKTLTDLSRRGQGKPNDLTVEHVTADFNGDFLLRRATLDFRRLDFAVPGVTAQMKGSYGLQSEQLDFAGDVRLQARVSQTMTGAKRVLLVPFDPLFKKNGAGTYLPVNISGTRAQPQVKLDWKKVF